MLNVLLDPLPETWRSPEGKEYPIDMDFRTGIQICMIQDDPDLADSEKTTLICSMIFLDEIPVSMDDIQECIMFYLSGWRHDKDPKKKQGPKRLMDFDIDQWRIYSAFLIQYQIDLNEIETMHFWVFMGLLSNLEDCAYTCVIDIRQRQIKPKMDAEERKLLKEAKEIYALDQVLTAEEKQALDYFDSFMNQAEDVPEELTDEEKEQIKIFESYADKV